jgi:hypothetical protein
VSAVGNAIAELERRRSEIDEAIAVLRRVDGNGATATAEPAPAKPTATNGKPRSTYGKVKPEQWDGARDWWDQGISALEIGRRLGITDVSVYDHAKAHKWPKRPRKIGAVVAVAQGERMPGKVRCPSCELWTEQDPCSNCGKKVRK